MTTKPEFTVDGVSVQTFEEIFEELVAGYQLIYGNDINVDQDSPDGQRIGIEAKARLDLQTFGLELYTQFDPDFSTGTFQDILFKLIGITVRPATRSTVEETVTTDRILTLTVPYIIEDDLGQEWQIDSDNNLVVGANTVTLSAVNFGDVAADPNTITKPKTIVLGVLSVTNPAAAVPGLDEETVEEKRIRRNKSLENSSFSTVGGLFAKLANITGVTDLIVYENDTDTPDQLKDPSTGELVAAVGMPANSIWCVVEGGEVADIAEIITKNKTAGCDLRGVEIATFQEDLLNPDGSTFVFIHQVKYDRPTEIQLFVEVTATRKITGQALDLDLIKAKIAEKLYNINESAIATELYAFGYQAGTNFILTDMKISDDDITYTDDSLPADFDEIWNIDVADITVTEVP